MIDLKNLPEVTFRYHNYEGKISTRRVRVLRLEFLFHPGYGYEPGWFLTGIDMDKQAVRSFRLSNIIISADDNPNKFSLSMEVPHD